MDTGHGKDLRRDTRHGEIMKTDSGYTHRMNSGRTRGRNPEASAVQASWLTVWLVFSV